jgi:hypothetical protein
VGSSRQGIVGGAIVDGPTSPVLYLASPEGHCTAVLVAPTLVATARHCIASLNETGSFACTASGDLQDGSISGQLGADNTPDSVSLFSAESVASGQAFGTTPDAVAVAILSTQTPTVCRDDLAFLVLNHPIPGLIPAPVRLGATEDGEQVEVSGYGLTQTAGDPLVLRVSRGAKIVGVGPAEPSTLAQEAPVRSVRVGPGTTTCNGDSGGPIQAADGAVIGIVSLGLQASIAGPFCASGDNPDTTGPRLADYASLVKEAFATADASPSWEDASSAKGGGPPIRDAGMTRKKDGAQSEETGDEVATGGSCAAEPAAVDSPTGLGAMALAAAATAAGRGRRRRS